jgi:hypothetical protein
MTIVPATIVLPKRGLSGPARVPTSIWSERPVHGRPWQYAFFCPRCAEVWCLILPTGCQNEPFFSITNRCAEHGHGHFLTSAYWEAYDKLELPIEIWKYLLALPVELSYPHQ